MYYEARIHKIVEVPSALAAAELIKEGRIQSFQVPKWMGTSGSTMLAVADGHINKPFFEIAMLKEENGIFFQVESVTNGWIDSPQELAKFFVEAETATFMKSKAKLNIGEASDTAIATFECGCCGQFFKGNVKQQLEFDQDAGYGLCDSCADDHY